MSESSEQKTIVAYFLTKNHAAIGVAVYLHLDLFHNLSPNALGLRGGLSGYSHDYGAWFGYFCMRLIPLADIQAHVVRTIKVISHHV